MECKRCNVSSRHSDPAILMENWINFRKGMEKRSKNGNT